MLGKYFILAVAGLVALAGAAAMVEMVYHLQLNQAIGPQLTFLGVALDAKSASSWLGSAAVLMVGLVCFEVTRRRFAEQWGHAQEFIEIETKRRESL